MDSGFGGFQSNKRGKAADPLRYSAALQKLAQDARFLECDREVISIIY